MQTRSSNANSADPPAYFVMEEDLKPWELYSLYGAEEPETLDRMKGFFTRYRAIRGKATNFAYTHDALQRSWCSFIRRWNAARREGLSFTSWLEDREGNRSNHAIGELRERVCQLAQREWRICYVHLVEGCANCSETRDRPTRTEWEHQLELWSLSEVERQAIGRYDRSRSQLEQAEIRNTLHRRGSHQRWHPRSRSRSRDRSHSQRQQSRSRSRASLVVVHHVGNIFKPATTWLPRVISWRVVKPADTIMFFATTGTTTTHIVVDKSLHDPAFVNRRPRFTSAFWSHLFKLLGTRLLMSTAAHPETDGQTERVNRVLEDVLRSYATLFSSWSDFLPLAEFALINGVHASSGLTPFFVNHPRVPALLAIHRSGDAAGSALGGGRKRTKSIAIGYIRVDSDVPNCDVPNSGVLNLESRLDIDVNTDDGPVLRPAFPPPPRAEPAASPDR